MCQIMLQICFRDMVWRQVSTIACEVLEMGPPSRTGLPCKKILLLEAVTTCRTCTSRATSIELDNQTSGLSRTKYFNDPIHAFIEARDSEVGSAEPGTTFDHVWRRDVVHSDEFKEIKWITNAAEQEDDSEHRMELIGFEAALPGKVGLRITLFTDESTHGAFQTWQFLEDRRIR